MNKLLFKDLELKESIHQAIEELGFEFAMDIQAKTIPPLLEGKDVVGLSRTGSGKTLAFAIPSIEMCNESSSKVQTLIICPTRELALQIEEVYTQLLKFAPNVNTVCLYGGSSIQDQMRKLKRGTQIVIGTPGRILDHIRRKTLNLSSLNYVVLDEADEMLNMGFIDDIKEILKSTPPEKQVSFFSATMPDEIKNISKSFQNDPVTFKLNIGDASVETIEQYYINIKNPSKMNALTNLIYKHNPKSAIVFANTKIMVDQIADSLKDKNIKIRGLHGDMSQNERTKVMTDFKKGRINILVASDVAARGIDVNDVEVIFNYDIPQNQEYYIHRIGRSGRAGKKGLAYTFVSGKRQYSFMQQIIRDTKANCKETTLPNKNELINYISDQFAEQIISDIDKMDDNTYSIVSKKLLNSGLDTDKILQVLVSRLLNLEIKEVETESFKDDRKRSSGEKSKDMTRLVIFLGKKDNIGAKNIVCALAEEVGLSGSQIGKIDVLDKCSFVDIDNNYVKQTIDKMSKAKIGKTSVKLEIKRDQSVPSNNDNKYRNNNGNNFNNNRRRNKSNFN